MAAADEVQFAALGKSFVLPLLTYPLLALGLTVVVYPLFRFTRRRLGVTRVSLRLCGYWL